MKGVEKNYVVVDLLIVRKWLRPRSIRRTRRIFSFQELILFDYNKILYLPNAVLNIKMEPNGNSSTAGWFRFWCSTRFSTSVKKCTSDEGNRETFTHRFFIAQVLPHQYSRLCRNQMLFLTRFSACFVSSFDSASASSYVSLISNRTTGF